MKSSQYIPGKEVILQYNAAQIKLYVDMSVGIGGDKWPAAEEFCHLISNPKWTSFFASLFNNKRVIELGSGNGM